MDVEGYGTITGDVAWGGNWFFLSEQHGQEISPDNIDRLTDCAWRIRQALAARGITEVDHVELFGPSERADSRNFVLCPGKAYDRSPCGTGTSAKLACLAADGKLRESEVWRQESIVGSVFEGSYRWAGSRVIPTIRGTAHVNAEATLLLDPRDPFVMGIRR
jgi:4-hydroxyproline epimerase